MKRIKMSATLVFVLLCTTSVPAMAFEGAYLGGKIGYNSSNPASSRTSDEAYLGGDAGYVWNQGDVLLGLDAFADNHRKSATGRDLGVDVKLGFRSDKFMPYIRLGLVGTKPGTRVHGGLGLEYKFDPHWSVVGEWTGDTKTVNSIDQTNSNISFGLNYYFTASKEDSSPTIAIEPAHDIAPPPPPEPVVVTPPPSPPPPPAPAPAPVLRTYFTKKAVTIEGANFDTGSARLKSSAFEQLDVLVNFSKRYKNAKLTVVGFTDSQGNENTNIRLSIKRAQAVEAYLVKKGIDSGRVKALGKGSASPIGDNRTAAGRALNRRVEINSVEHVAE